MTFGRTRSPEDDYLTAFLRLPPRRYAPVVLATAFAAGTLATATGIAGM